MLSFVGREVDNTDTVGTTRLSDRSEWFTDVPELLVVINNVTIVGFRVGHAERRCNTRLNIGYALIWWSCLSYVFIYLY